MISRRSSGTAQRRVSWSTALAIRPVAPLTRADSVWRNATTPRPIPHRRVTNARTPRTPICCFKDINTKDKTAVNYACVNSVLSSPCLSVGPCVLSPSLRKQFSHSQAILFNLWLPGVAQETVGGLLGSPPTLTAHATHRDGQAYRR